MATIVMGSLSVLSSFFDSDGHIQEKVARAWSRFLLFVSGVRVDVQGLEQLDLSANYVFVANHLSLMDTPVVLASVPVRFLFIAAEKYFRIPFLGTHLRRGGHLPVNILDPRGALKVMTEAARLIRERNLSIVLFPEGTRARGPMGEFKEGAAYIGIKSGIPVVPMAILGTRDILPAGSLHLRAGRAQLRIGEPLPTGNLTLKDRAQLTSALRARVCELLQGRAETVGNAAGRR
ncbi:MAG: lysophospholipid acyltransferase family protein [Bryobacteraceae bacterium]